MPNTSPLDSKLVSCKEKLINLTRQNNLLFYKKRKTSSLVVKTKDIQSFYDALLDEKGFRFWEFPETEDKEPNATEGSQQGILFSDEAPEEPQEEVDWMSIHPPEDDEIVCEFSSNEELHKILKNIYRRAKTEYDERGLNIAYIFFGLMEWSEKQTSERVKSPIILVPIKIEHKSASESYHIILGDEDVVLNPALRVKFKKDFNIVLPELEDAPQEWDLKKYFSVLEEQLLALKVKVSSDVHIGLFSFHKLIMYNDYEKHHELMKKHFLISCFGGEGNIDGINAIGVDSSESLDEIRDIKRQFHVLDADSSQQRCIEVACNGASFVMIGPPGTGKSQTIANIIAEFIEDGKSVLFVSEKMAALEVVFKRLKECDLSDFCLELHSHKANKKQVITELGKSLTERVEPRETILETDYKQFLRLRDKLNNYLISLHTRRQPLGLSVYEVLGRLSILEQMPYLPIGLSKNYINDDEETNKIILSCPECSQKLRVPNVEENRILVTCPKCKKEFSFEKHRGSVGVQGITQEALMEFDALFDGLESLWDVFIRGSEFSWYGFKNLNYTPALRYQIEELLAKILDRTSDLISQVNNFQAALGLLPPVSFTDFLRMGDILEHLAQEIYIPFSWTEKFDYSQMVSLVTKSRELKQRYALANEYLGRKYTEGFFALSDDYLRNLILALRDLQMRLGIQDYQVAELIQDLSIIREYLRLLEETLRHILSNQEIVWQDLDIPAVKNLKNADFICRLVELLADEEKRPEAFWFNVSAYEELNARIQSLETQIQGIKSIEEDLFAAKYKPEIATLDVNRLLNLFKKNGFYRTYFLKYLSPRYHKDIRNILSHSQDKKKISPKTFFDDLLRIKHLIELMDSIKKHEESDKKLLARFYAGEKTQLDKVRLALEGVETAKALMKKLGLPDSQSQIEMLGSIELQQRCSTIAEQIANQDKKVFEFLLKKGIPVSDIKSLTIPDLLMNLSQIVASSASLLAVLPSFQNCLIAKSQFPSIQEIEESLKNLHEWRHINEEVDRQSQEFINTFGKFYSGINTDWVAIEKAMLWYQQLLSMLSSLPSDGKLRDLLIKSNTRIIDVSAIRAFKGLMNELSNDFSGLWRQFNTIVLNGKEISWETGEFPLVVEKVKQLKDSLDELKLWVDWLGLSYSLGRAGLEKFLSEVFKSRVQIFSEQVRLIFRKGIYSEWLDTIYAEDQVLKDFRGEDHTKARDKFIDLDIKLTRLSRSLVIQSGNERKPMMLDGSSMGSQVGILRREIAKQKRHKPIKRLFSEIFDLVTKLKKCFLMSPMSVCQFLEPGKFKFDLVIFDEASQICVEDAFPAILRGGQVIIAGDNKQLPPTSFFKSEEQYEFDEEEDIPDIENLECILDECRGLGIREHLLKWHYRSRHEDLIIYSNYKFYQRQLVTFPAADVDAEHLGIKYDYVENAIYDRGGRRNNLIEAKRVAELVFEHFKNYPGKSLGVATLSIAQMEAVWDAIELKLKENPEYSKFFIEDRLEGFFVKNLENVQGDERDVIIFSVGYGKDATGRLSMHFGPLNKNGGERRLNVLITRAREKNIVVTSIRAADFSSNITAEGVLHLRNYLAFAEKGMDFLDKEIAGTAEDFESPLEESVAASIRQMGYEVISQVGCAGYRIDLGVIDPVNPKRYILGIECDGATYHSSHSARDRDRLRQAVLENMGWGIYRIWSPDWVYQRTIEVAKLKNAIETARFERDSSTPKKRTVTTEEPLKLKVVNNFHQLDGSSIVGEEYCLSELGRRYKPKDFYSSGGQAIRSQLKKVIRDEAPIHIDLLFRRVMICYQLEKMGDRIYNRLMELLKEVVRNNSEIRPKSNFVYTDDPIIARRPNPRDEATLREIEHIAPEEIQDAMIKIVHLLSGVTMDCLFSETLKFFGFQRQTESVVKILKQNVKKLVKAGTLQAKDDFFILEK